MDIKKYFSSPFFVWIKWIFHTEKMRKRFPASRLKLHTYARNTRLGKYVTIYENSSLDNCIVNDYTYIAARSSIANTHIGKFCSIGPGCLCGMGMHPTKKFVSTHPIFFSKQKQVQVSFVEKEYFKEHSTIKIGNDVWIGANVIILDGVSIGDGVIIGAGAVVNKDVPPYAIVGGVPAKIIRYRFTKDQIEFLLKDQWWNKPDEWLKQNYKIMHDIEIYEKRILDFASIN